MWRLMIVILASYAVKCDDDSSYYIVEIPEETRQEPKPFRVYWNVPTMQCRSKKIPFENLYERFGIIQNAGDTFRGNQIAILYDPGDFPALLKNETSDKFKVRNGGVPQEGDLEKHWSAFRKVLEQSIPDPEFSGVGIIDFESWRPIFRQNFGVLAPYKEFSYQIERKRHWFWPEKAIQAKARQRFEEAARSFMQTSLVIAREMRPRAAWGYYAFPYCFNTPTAANGPTCSATVQQENDRTGWLWRHSGALFPSTYLARNTTPPAAKRLVGGRVAEAARVARDDALLLPYFWYRYREGGFLAQDVLAAVLETFAGSAASGFVVWGSSADVDTVAKCERLLAYTEEILGPAIAAYTKPGGSAWGAWGAASKVRPAADKNKTSGFDLAPAAAHPPFALNNDTRPAVPEPNTDGGGGVTDEHGGLLHIKRNTLLELLFNILLYRDSGEDDRNDDEIEYHVSEELTRNASTGPSSVPASSTESNLRSVNVTPEVNYSIATALTTVNPMNTTDGDENDTFPLAETQVVTSYEVNRENGPSIISSTDVYDFTDVATPPPDLLGSRPSVTMESVSNESSTLDAVGEKIKNSVEDTKDPVTYTTTADVFETNITIKNKFNSSSITNITTNPLLILENRLPITVKSTNYQDISTTLSYEINTKNSEVNTVTEYDFDRNITNKDKYDPFEILANIAENNSTSESSFNLNHTSDPIKQITTYDITTVFDKYLPLQSSSSETSSLITSFDTSDSSIESSEVITEKEHEEENYHWNDNAYSTSSTDTLILTTDTLTTMHPILEPTSTIILKHGIIDNDYTTEDAMSTLKLENIPESFTELEDKFESNRDYDYDNMESTNYEQSPLHEPSIEITSTDNKKTLKTIKKGFHEDFNIIEATTENISCNGDTSFLEENGKVETTRITGERTTDSVGVSPHADFKICTYLALSLVVTLLS